MFQTKTVKSRHRLFTGLSKGSLTRSLIVTDVVQRIRGSRARQLAGESSVTHTNSSLYECTYNWSALIKPKTRYPCLDTSDEIFTHNGSTPSRGCVSKPKHDPALSTCVLHSPVKYLFLQHNCSLPNYSCTISPSEVHNCVWVIAVRLIVHLDGSLGSVGIVKDYDKEDRGSISSTAPRLALRPSWPHVQEASVFFPGGNKAWVWSSLTSI
jgi:hypothetical protein